jgi:cell filamentation protein
MAVLKNKLGIRSQVELNREEERISKLKAKQLYDSGKLATLKVGSFVGLKQIHKILFGDIYEFAGKLREVNVAKGSFRFAPVMYLAASLKAIDKMPQQTFDQIIEKYIEMNVAHPFREGNGRAMRIWLDLMLKQELKKVIDWNKVDKEEYLSAMARSVVKDLEIKQLLKSALTKKIDARDIFMKGIDTSYYFEGYDIFKTEDL